MNKLKNSRRHSSSSSASSGRVTVTTRHKVCKFVPVHLFSQISSLARKPLALVSTEAVSWPAVDHAILHFLPPLPTPSSSSTCPGVRARVGFCRRHPGWSGYTPQRDHVSHMLVTSLVLVTTTHSFCDSTPQLPVTWRQAWSRSGHKICCVLPTHLATSTGVCSHTSQNNQYTFHLLQIRSKIHQFTV